MSGRVVSGDVSGWGFEGVGESVVVSADGWVDGVSGSGGGSRPGSGAGRPRGSKNGRRRVGAVRAGDVEVLGFVARYRFVTARQIARRFGSHYDTVRSRLSRLRGEGLVESWQVAAGRCVYAGTRKGLRFVGCEDLVVARPTLGAMRHTLGLADVGIGLEVAGERVVTDAVARSWAARVDPKGTAGVGNKKALADWRGVARERVVEKIVEAGFTQTGDGSDMFDGHDPDVFVLPVPGKKTPHSPDLVLLREGGNVAVELELTKKEPRDWAVLLQAYAHAGSPFAHVLYLTDRRDIATGLLRVSEQHSLHQVVTVRRWSPVDQFIMKSGGIT